MKYLRILSLLPAATEIIYLLGLEKYLVGVDHDSDYPAAVKKLPRVTSSLVSNKMFSLEIDQKVKKLGHAGVGISHIDSDQLKKLKPSLILTQELCEVCSIPFTEVKKATKVFFSHSEVNSGFHNQIATSALPPRDDDYLKIISLEPESISDILENILVVGENTGKKKKAEKKILSLRSRMPIIDSRLRGNDKRKPKVLVIEWLEPLMAAGHWVPEMVETAGGEMLITKSGEKSKYISESEIQKLNPDICIIAPCGFDIKRTLKEKKLIENIKKLLPKKCEIFLVDGNSYLTRPGPRIVDGVEILSEIINPEVFKRIFKQKDWLTY